MSANRILNINKNDSNFSSLVAERLIQAYLRKKLGGNPAVLVNEIQINEKNYSEAPSDIYVHLDVEAVLPESALLKLLSSREISCS